MRLKIIKESNNSLFKINRVFPTLIANRVNSIFKKQTRWKRMLQTRKNHYKTIMKKKINIWPDMNEIYYADFYRSTKLEKNLFIKDSIKKYILPTLIKKFRISDFEIRCHKFLPGQFLRAHFDHYISRLAITINLNKKWKADWGGLLCVLNDKTNKVNTLVPEWNSMNILISKNKKKHDRKSGHFVTSVEKYARESRYSITIFAR